MSSKVSFILINSRVLGNNELVYFDHSCCVCVCVCVSLCVCVCVFLTYTVVVVQVYELRVASLQVL